MIKEAGPWTWALRAASKAPSMAGISTATKHAVGGAIEKPFKNILVRGAPEFARKVSGGRYAHQVGKVTSDGGFFDPKAIVGNTVQAGRDLAAPWRGPGTFGSKLKNAVTDIIDNTRYKPGEIWKNEAGETMQNMHRRTIGGMGLHAATQSAPFVAGGTFLFGGKDKSVGSRAAGAAGLGLGTSRLGMPIAGPAFVAKTGWDLLNSGFKKAQQQNMNVY